MPGFAKVNGDGELAITIKGLLGIAISLITVVSVGAGVNATVVNLKIANEVGRHETQPAHSGAATKEGLSELREIVLVQAAQQTELTKQVERLVEAQWALINKLVLQNGIPVR